MEARAKRGHETPEEGGLRGYASCVYTQYAYTTVLKAVFVELPAFARRRFEYLDDADLAELQSVLMKNPEASILGFQEKQGQAVMIQSELRARRPS